MRYLFLTLGLLLATFSIAQETMNYPKYTLGEVYEMIAKEKSDTFTLKNANIILDTVADKHIILEKRGIDTFVPIRTDSIEIYKAIVLENVFMQGLYINESYAVAFNNIVFHNSVFIKNSALSMAHCHFKNSVQIRYDDEFYEHRQGNFGNYSSGSTLSLERNIFELDPEILSGSNLDDQLPIALWLKSSILKGTNKTSDISWFVARFGFVNIEDNKFLGEYPNYILFSRTRGQILNNDFGNRLLQIQISDDGIRNLEIRENQMQNKLLMRIPESVQNIRLDWSQFPAGILELNKYTTFIRKYAQSITEEDFELNFRNQNYLRLYTDSARVVDNKYYKSEIALLGTLNAVYKRQHDLESANASYISLKNLETKRLKHLYVQNPSFDTFFEWKVNQFLKTFSEYGTKPAKAITYSVYVVFFFALIYLFFPNHWDSHGKNRIINRFSFFFKYMKKDAGMQEVYLEEKQSEILAYNDYKELIESSGKEVPRFFHATALPMYKWAISSTKLTASLLSKVDVMKGTWSDLPSSKRFGKSTLLITAFLIALIYDLFIKILNALMLSINTFTTLGFGEIPIKGLPRYLAIIQGFIGWFMLTIFSVSLISQLLN